MIDSRRNNGTPLIAPVSQWGSFTQLYNQNLKYLFCNSFWFLGSKLLIYFLQYSKFNQYRNGSIIALCKCWLLFIAFQGTCVNCMLLIANVGPNNPQASLIISTNSCFFSLYVHHRVVNCNVIRIRIISHVLGCKWFIQFYSENSQRKLTTFTLTDCLLFTGAQASDS